MIFKWCVKIWETAAYQFQISKWKNTVCNLRLDQASFFDEISQMCATNLPVKLSFDKNPLSFEKKVFDFSENLRTFVGRVVEFWENDAIHRLMVFLGRNAMIP